MTDSTAAVVVFGAGSWGTALAMQAARVAFGRGQRVVLNGRDEASMLSMANTRENSRYLPDIRFPPCLLYTSPSPRDRG